MRFTYMSSTENVRRLEAYPFISQVLLILATAAADTQPEQEREEAEHRPEDHLGIDQFLPESMMQTVGDRCIIRRPTSILPKIC